MLEDAVGAVHVLKLALGAGIHIEIDVRSGLQVGNAGIQFGTLRLDPSQLIGIASGLISRSSNSISTTSSWLSPIPMIPPLQIS